MAANAEEIFRSLSAEDSDTAPMIVESLCMNCEENGTTKIMCISIPYYKAVILMSFECPHCGFKNNEIQSGEAVQEHGTEMVLRVREQADLRRQLVKSEYASVEVPELELTIPSKSQPAEVTTVEGILQRAREGLAQGQEQRRLLDAEGAAQIDAFLLRLDRCMNLDETWTLKLRDPTGNCFIQNTDVRHVDPRCITSHYHRTLDERKLLGLAADSDEEVNEGPAPAWNNFDEAKEEVLHFPSGCPNCRAPCIVNMKATDIPFFQAVIIMSMVCDRCGHRTNEVKSGGAIRDQGCRISVRVEQVGPAALCSRFTTVEGILTATRTQLDAQQGSFLMGDSAKVGEKGALAEILSKLDDVVAMRLPATVVLDDPTGNSYVQSLSAPMLDSRLTKDFYERTYEQNDELGINDMKVTNYGELDGVAEEGEEDEGAEVEEKHEDEQITKEAGKVE